MSLKETVLQKLADWRPGSQRQVLTFAEEGSPWVVVLTGERGDQLSCQAWDLAVRQLTPPDNLIDLNIWAQQIARRATGLLEKLTVLEIDNIRQEALLRSEEPSHNRDKIAYYEILVKAQGDASLRRFEASQEAHTRRVQVAFALTNEALAKLATDLIPAP